MPIANADIAAVFDEIADLLDMVLVRLDLVAGAR